MPLIIGAKSASASTGVANSCRVNRADTPSITKDNGTPSSETTGTISFWLKRCNLSIGDEFVLDGRIDANNRFKFAFNSSDIMEFWNSNGGSDDLSLMSNRKFRDVSAWMHIVIRIDTTQATDSDRVRAYINSVDEKGVGGYSTETYPAQDSTDTVFFEDSAKQNVGVYYDGSSFQHSYDGYLAEVVYCDGQSLAPTEFGEFDEDSPTIWKPKDVSGLTFGNNGFYLDFEDSADLGADVSGNSNDFTATNLDATDQATDSPTNNFTTLNQLQNNLVIGTISQGNCKFTGSGYPTVYSTQAVTKGKWYMEVKLPTAAGFMIGVSAGSPNATAFGVGAYDWGFYYDGKIWNSNSEAAYGSAASDDDILGFALDVDNSAMYAAINNTWQDSGDPTSGASKTGAVAITAVGSTPLGVYHFVVGDYSGNTPIMEANFGGCPAFTVSSANQDADGYGNFEYAPPSGYYALCTKNLAEYG